MTDDRRMTTDRFYGGVTNRLQNLRSMLEYVQEHEPSRTDLTDWVIAHTQAGSADAVQHHLSFLNSIAVINLSETTCTLGEYGQAWLQDHDPETLYDALTTGVKGFETILEALSERPMTDEDIMDLLVTEFEEAEMTTPGPAARHREWLQVLGFVDYEDGVSQLTADGRTLVEEASEESTPSIWTPPPEIAVGDRLTKEEIEAVFDTGFGYRISGINPRRNERDRRYVLVFAAEDGPYDDSVTEGQFEYIGEGLTGDKSETSPGNSALIDAISSNIPVHFFYQASGASTWEYHGLVDVLSYEVEHRDGRAVLVFRMAHQESASGESDPEAVATEREHLLQALDEGPQLTEDETAYTDVERQVRDTAFSELVKAAYDETCAICGRRRETPDGQPEVEAAHIYPKRKGGADDVRNGLALCKLHHWAFDSGWLSLTNGYEMLVRDAPERDGYHEFKQLEGRRIRLPDQERMEPDSMYLERHREIHRFDSS
jgi:putative restriction endonuclease